MPAIIQTLVRVGAEVRPGRIGIFIMGRERYIKELGDGIQISQNSTPEYVPRKMADSHNVRAWC